MGGSNKSNQSGDYGTQYTPAPTNMPGARSQQGVAVDKSGIVWMYGGIDATLSNYAYNDLWSFGQSIIVPLPVQQVTLAGTPGNHENVFTWQTIGELNTSTFIVERSTDGINFSDIGTVKAVGSGDNSYSLTDTHLPVSTMYYYRIEMEDKDGSTSYSQTILLQIQTGSGLTVYPNPAASFVMIRMSDNSLLNTPVRLLDLNGRLIAEQVITGQQQMIDLSRLAHGIYLLQFANGMTSKVLKE